MKEQYENKSVKIQSEINRIEGEIENSKNGIGGTNEFIETFKKYKGLKDLTRDVFVELIENIFIHENGTVEIHLKCKDEFAKFKESLLKSKKSQKQIS
ncbi:MAG: DUF4368 domain-containing protein [Clostridia bacterium]|nr:DUF4368 domain-containing protein [Clostridia bacterium]